jgi:hypothetical protein
MKKKCGAFGTKEGIRKNRWLRFVKDNKSKNETYSEALERLSPLFKTKLSKNKKGKIINIGRIRDSDSSRFPKKYKSLAEFRLAQKQNHLNWISRFKRWERFNRHPGLFAEKSINNIRFPRKAGKKKPSPILNKIVRNVIQRSKRKTMAEKLQEESMKLNRRKGKGLYDYFRTF